MFRHIRQWTSHHMQIMKEGAQLESKIGQGPVNLPKTYFNWKDFSQLNNLYFKNNLGLSSRHQFGCSFLLTEMKMVFTKYLIYAGNFYTLSYGILTTILGGKFSYFPSAWRSLYRAMDNSIVGNKTKYLGKYMLGSVEWMSRISSKAPSFLSDGNLATTLSAIIINTFCSCCHDLHALGGVPTWVTSHHNLICSGTTWPKVDPFTP